MALGYFKKFQLTENVLSSLVDTNCPLMINNKYHIPLSVPMSIKVMVKTNGLCCINGSPNITTDQNFIKQIVDEY